MPEKLTVFHCSRVGQRYVTIEVYTTDGGSCSHLFPAVLTVANLAETEGRPDGGRESLDNDFPRQKYGEVLNGWQHECSYQDGN